MASRCPMLSMTYGKASMLPHAPAMTARVIPLDRSLVSGIVFLKKHAFGASFVASSAPHSLHREVADGHLLYA
ncbi:hypothetical protein YTPLAS18_29960 [Nitrospira sp.]|nr:hypothetical protein YTPLAS18_29960 [Nitrospira sp.]